MIIPYDWLSNLGFLCCVWSHLLCETNLGRPTSWKILWRCTKPSRTSTKKCPFLHRGLECKSRKSRDTSGNRQIWPWSTKWSRAKANKVLPRERTGHSKHPLPTTQKILHMDVTRLPMLKSDWLYSLWPKKEKLYTKTRPGADGGSDHELLKPNSDLNWTK